MASKTILLKGDGIFKEAKSSAAITPGHLINLASTGLIAVHAGADLNAAPAFAIENENVGKDIDTAWSSGDLVTYIIPERGAEINALVPAGAAAIVIGDLLASAGDGTLKKTAAAAPAATNVRSLVARAMEAVDNSAGGTPVRIRVEIL